MHYVIMHKKNINVAVPIKAEREKIAKAAR